MDRAKSVWQNRITVTGAILAAVSVLFFVSFQMIELAQPTSNPYTGLWSFLVLPAILVTGLLLIPLGAMIERRKRRRLHVGTGDLLELPHFDLNDPHHRRLLMIFVLGTLVVIPLIAISSYEGYHYTDSTQFCGQVCHSVMHPEYTAYLGSPHARVSCAACHIGPGANWYVKSKISGVRQVLAVTFNTFNRPIHTPIKDLRPARETCEQCHWPEKFFGAQLRTRAHYYPDEKNTREEIQLLVKTGGAESSQGPASGIHWHMALSQKIEYVAVDTARQVIPWVRATSRKSAEVRVFRSDGKAAGDPPPAGEMRTVDCMDCHNRPTHVIRPPDRVINTSLEAGRLDRTLPFIKKVAVEALVQPYSDEGDADLKIEAYVRDFYQKLDPGLAGTRKGSIDQAVQEIRVVYHRNFFPRMKVNWRAYPDNIGHMVFDGCFRCHDGRHVGPDNTSISRDCKSCHDFLEPASGGQALAYAKGIPQHPIKLEGKHAQLNCSACHTGGPGPERACSGCHTTQSLFRQGKSPSLPGLKGTPTSVMADLDCDACHDVSKPQTQANIGAQCAGCHDKSYPDMIQMWKDDAAAGRAKAQAAIQSIQGNAELASQLQSTLNQVDKAHAVHNTDYADAIYQQIVKLASEKK
jgi:hypothetical protein